MVEEVEIVGRKDRADDEEAETALREGLALVLLLLNKGLGMWIVVVEGVVAVVAVVAVVVVVGWGSPWWFFFLGFMIEIPKNLAQQVSENIYKERETE